MYVQMGEVVGEDFKELRSKVLVLENLGTAVFEEESQERVGVGLFKDFLNEGVENNVLLNILQKKFEYGVRYLRIFLRNNEQELTHFQVEVLHHLIELILDQ